MICRCVETVFVSDLTSIPTGGIASDAASSAASLVWISLLLIGLGLVYFGPVWSDLVWSCLVWSSGLSLVWSRVWSTSI